MSSIDQQFVEFIVKSLVSNPDDVKIVRTIDEKGVLLQLEVAGDDLGRVIGKRGATAQSIRTLLRALGTKNDARYNLKIVDTGEGAPPKPERKEEDDRPADEAPADEPEESVSDDEAPANDDSDDNSDVEGDVDDTDDDDEDDDKKEEKSYADKHRADLDDLDDLDI